MFGLHGAQFERLAEAGMDTEQVYILRQILTNPNLELKHSGVITFDGQVKGNNIRAGRWAKCIKNWSYSGKLPSLGGHHGFIMARECADGKGNRVSGGAVKIFLPVSPSQDPNVEIGDIIMFFQMPDGTHMAPGYGDNRIGTVMSGIQGDTQVKGWGVMNGTNNAIALGGSGIDAGDKFLRQWTSQSQNKTTGGSATGALDLAVTIASGGSGTSGAGGSHTHSISTTGAHTHTVTGGTHASHDHLPATTQVYEVDPSWLSGAGGSTSPKDVASNTFTGYENSGNTTDQLTHDAETSSSSGGHTHSLGTESTHTHSTPAHAHTASVAAGGGGGATAATIPPFVYVAMLERLNNSG